MNVRPKFVTRLTHKLTTRRGVSRRRRPILQAFERLEQRTVLAGNVMAVVGGENLVLKGDDDSNSIVVDQVGLAPDQYRVSSGVQPHAD